LQWRFLKIHVEEEENAEDQSGKVAMVKRLDSLQKTKHLLPEFSQQS
jgi:PII-like signaling protein